MNVGRHDVCTYPVADTMLRGLSICLSDKTSIGGREINRINPEFRPHILPKSYMLYVFAFGLDICCLRTLCIAHVLCTF